MQLTPTKRGSVLQFQGNKTIKSWKISFFGIRLTLETDLFKNTIFLELKAFQFQIEFE